MRNDIISVVIPLYNKEQSIGQTLESILGQSCENFEIIVVDDGSTDGSVAKVESFRDSRIQLIRQANGGPSKARNEGVKNAKGDWVLFIDADDGMLPGTIGFFLQKIKTFSDDADMFLGEAVINNGDTEHLAIAYKDGLVQNPFKTRVFGRLCQCSGSTVYRKKILEKYTYDERLYRYEDLQLLMHLYKEYRLYLCSKTVVRINLMYSEASRFRRDIKEDFLGYLDFKGKTFWEKMTLYFFYLGEREYYPVQCRKLYPWLYRRYDWLLLYKIITLFAKVTTLFASKILSKNDEE